MTDIKNPCPHEVYPTGGASTTVSLNQLTTKVEELTTVVNEQMPAADAAMEEKATELQRFWSWAALGIFVVMAVLIFLVCLNWYSTDQGFRVALITSSTNDLSQVKIDQYTKLSDQAFERSWRVVDRVVMGGLMSLLTLIIGYIFGTRRSRHDVAQGAGE
ncbi:MAG: hypothetical protein WCS52_07260 [bacterium]